MTSSPPNSVTEKHLGRTHAQPLRRCTTKNHLEAKDVEAEDVDDVAAWPLAEADADALGDVQGREGPEADQALVSQAAEDVEAEDVDDVAARRLSPRLTRTCSGTSKAAKGRRPIERSWRRPPRTGSSSKRMSLANRGATSTTSRPGRSPRRTRTRRGMSKAAKGRTPIERSWRRPPRTGSSLKLVARSVRR